jgi:hypothetical protein
MSKSSTILHVFALGALFVIQAHAMTGESVSGIRRALQTIDAKEKAQPAIADHAFTFVF